MGKGNWERAIAPIITSCLAVLCVLSDTRAVAAVSLVRPIVETPEVLDEIVDPPGDADDPAIWLHPTDPSLSLVLGTLKNAGLGVYGLDGKVLQSILPGDVRYNNVDLLYGFNLGGQSVDLAIASDRLNDTLAIFKIDPTTRLLENVGAPDFGTIFTPAGEASNGSTTAYGLTSYISPFSNKNYVFVSQRETGNVAQLELFDNGSGKVSAKSVRSLVLPIPEGGEYPEVLFFDESDQEFENVSSNFKFVGWENIANAFPNPLLIDTTSLNPRQDKSESVPEPSTNGFTLLAAFGMGYLLQERQKKKNLG